MGIEVFEVARGGDFSRDEFDYLFDRTRWIKERFKRYELYQPLRDRTLAMVFEKASTRTRVSFEAGMNQLGGIAINLNRSDTQLSRGEVWMKHASYGGPYHPQLLEPIVTRAKGREPALKQNHLRNTFPRRRVEQKINRFLRA